MKSVETYLHDIQDALCDKIVHHWEDDQRFANQREMQQYNCGVAEAMEIIRNVLDGREFKSPLLQSMKEWFAWKNGRGGIVKKFRSTDEITKEDLEKMYNAIAKFDNYISSATRKPTDENIGLYEHWIDCRYDIENLIVTDR